MYGSGLSICAIPEKLRDQTITKHEDQPWLLYYAQWFDPWLLGDSYTKLYKTIPEVKTREISDDLYCLTPSASDVIGLKRSLKCKFQFCENYWYNWHMLQACTTFEQVFPKRKIFVIRKKLGASLGDDEIKKLLE